MQINQKSIKDFQRIYQRKTGKKISISEARELGGKVFDLFMAIYEPIENKNETPTK